MVIFCLWGNGRENVLLQEDKSSNQLRAENLTLITADSSEEGRVRGRETQSQPRKKGLSWLTCQTGGVMLYIRYVMYSSSDESIIVNLFIAVIESTPFSIQTTWSWGSQKAFENFYTKKLHYFRVSTFKYAASMSLTIKPKQNQLIVIRNPNFNISI